MFMLPASVELGRGTVSMLVSVCGPKSHMCPRTAVPLLYCETFQLQLCQCALHDSELIFTVHKI